MIILASIPGVYADDDNWIDGIKFRFTNSKTHVLIDYKSADGRKNDEKYRIANPNILE